MLRGLFAGGATTCVLFPATGDALDGADDFGGKWSELTPEVRAGWERVARLVAMCPLLFDAEGEAEQAAIAAIEYRAPLPTSGAHAYDNARLNARASIATECNAALLAACIDEPAIGGESATSPTCPGCQSTHRDRRLIVSATNVSPRPCAHPWHRVVQ